MEKKAFHVLCSNQEIGSIHTVSGKVTQMIKKESATMQETWVQYLCGKIPGGGNGNASHYSYLENPMDRGAWQAAIHGVTKNQTQLSD